MQIIPVIDLMQGIVVHAREGRREQYQPLTSRLSPSPEPMAVIEGLLKLYPFKTLYIADLDALMGQNRQTSLLTELLSRYSEIQFWIDQGLANPIENKPAWAENVVSVIGTESLQEENGLPFVEHRSRIILSLDFRENRLLGPERVLDEPQRWSDVVIVMSLSHVGSREGPDFERIAHFIKRYPEKRMIAAGGVRNPADLMRLDALGVSGALIASALHSGEIDARDLESFANPIKRESLETAVGQNS
jgi:phosphoribosylformimino-5-aminoimidazole carboxamide ribotide isomerase